MSQARQFMDMARQGVQQAMQSGGGGDGFDLNRSDFPAARGEGASVGTRIAAASVSLDDAAEALSRSHYEMGAAGPVHALVAALDPLRDGGVRPVGELASPRANLVDCVGGEQVMEQWRRMVIGRPSEGTVVSHIRLMPRQPVDGRAATACPASRRRSWAAPRGQ